MGVSSLEKRLARYPLALEMEANGTASPDTLEALRLLRDGLRGVDIAKRMGLSVSRTYELLKDPDGSRADVRRHKSHGTCLDCGGPTFNGGAWDTPDRCQECEHKRVNARSRQRIVDSIQDWHERYGTPPGAMDWNVPMAELSAHPERLRQIYAAHQDRTWPAVTNVQHIFGSWSAAIRAAGFTPTKPGHRIHRDTWHSHRWSKGELMLSAETVVTRELEKMEQRKAKLKDELRKLEVESTKLQAAYQALTTA